MRRFWDSCSGTRCSCTLVTSVLLIRLLSLVRPCNIFSCTSSAAPTDSAIAYQLSTLISLVSKVGAQCKDELTLHELMRSAQLRERLVLSGADGELRLHHCGVLCFIIPRSGIFWYTPVEYLGALPGLQFQWFRCSRDSYGLIGFHGKKGIYSGAFHPVVQTNGVAGSYTAHGGPIPRARKCQHITEHAGRLTCATQGFDDFYSAELAGRSSASSLVWELLGKGSCTSLGAFWRPRSFGTSRLSVMSFLTSALTMELALELKSRGMSVPV